MAKTDDSESDEFKGDSKGLAAKWKSELGHARKWVKKEWWEAADEANAWYLDKPGARTAEGRERHGHWNMYSVGIQLQKALLFGKTPNATVGRTFQDQNDQIARVGGEMIQRNLDQGYMSHSSRKQENLTHCVFDFLITGGGVLKLRYEPSIEQKPGKAAIVRNGKEVAPKIDPYEKKSGEQVCYDHWYWRDVLWSPCRKFEEARWLSFATYMSKTDVKDKWGSKTAAKLEFSQPKSKEMTQRDANEAASGQRAIVHEVWDKRKRMVYWASEGSSEIIDAQKDELELENFWPCPEPMFDNTTTSAWVPRPDWAMHQDQYKELELVSARIWKLVEAVKVNGAYNKTFGTSLQKLLTSPPGTIIPVDDMQRIGEKGGLKGIIDFLPIEMIVAALDKLRDYRNEVIQAIYMFTGLADLMHGQSTSDVATTATERRIQAKFASVRLQAKQDRIAKFVTEAARIETEIMAKKFSVETIVECSNIERASPADAQIAMQAAQFIKSNLSGYRIDVKSEAISMQNFAELKEERSGFITSLASFIQAVAPMVQMVPQALPLMLNLMKWSVAAYKGATSIEGEFDQAIATATTALQQAQAQPQQGPPPDPKLMTVQAKAQGDLAKVQAETQADVIRLQVETTEKNKQEQNQAVANIAETRAKHAITHSGGFVPPTGAQ